MRVTLNFQVNGLPAGRLRAIPNCLQAHVLTVVSSTAKVSHCSSCDQKPAEMPELPALGGCMLSECEHGFIALEHEAMLAAAGG